MQGLCLKDFYQPLQGRDIPLAQRSNHVTIKVNSKVPVAVQEEETVEASAE